MSRTFIYSFTPPSLDPAPGATIELDVSEIEDAGIREVLQTPGAAYGAWSILVSMRHRAASREGARFTFDLDKRRLEIAFGRKSALELVDAAQQFQLGVGRSSPMLAAPSRSSRSADDEA
ncbi:hypothetical protein [Roseibium algicola]|uniref:hypothetical protein n=1 Tax=Roseibium algicola TaxID=2857014 RepID=UPI0019808E23|nr:hypothetical protein [Roseibium aggregatum]